MTNVVALLPMKGNSERVPNKNLKQFCGEPLYHKVLRSLLDSKYISKVIINTDSAQIKHDAIKHFENGVIIHDRPLDIQGDFVSMNKIIANDIERYSADVYVQTHSTNPMLQTESIDKAIELFINKATNEEFDSIFSVTKIQTRLYDKNVKAYNHDPKNLIRTQDLEPLYEENSNFYIFSKDSFNASYGKRIGIKPKMYEIDKIEAVDIDSPQDFTIAESLYKLLR